MGGSVCETLKTAFVLVKTPKSNDEFRYHYNFQICHLTTYFLIFQVAPKVWTSWGSFIMASNKLWGFNLVNYTFIFPFLCHLPIQVEEKSYELPCQVDSDSYEMFSHHSGIMDFGWIIFTNVTSWEVEKSEKRYLEN